MLPSNPISERDTPRDRAAAEFGRLEVTIGARTLEAFHVEAARRGMRFDVFMKQLLLTVVRDNLFSAIIDDGK